MAKETSFKTKDWALFVRELKAVLEANSIDSDALFDHALGADKISGDNSVWARFFKDSHEANIHPRVEYDSNLE